MTSHRPRTPPAAARSSAIWTVWLVLAAVLSSGLSRPVQAAPAATPEPEPAPSSAATTPSESEERPGLPPPPVDGPPSVDDEPIEPVELTEEERQALRLRDFTDHLLKAQGAASRERWDDAIREYTAALELLPGDASALLGRALARKAKTEDGACPSRAIKDLLELEKEDPRGSWLDQRSDVIDWMGDCGGRYQARRLALARELATEETGSRGRPDDARVRLAVLLTEGLLDGDPHDEQQAVRTKALEQLEAYRNEVQTSKSIPTAEALRLQADLYRELDELESAAEVYDELLATHPAAPQSVDVAALREELQFQLELRKLQATQGFRPTAKATEAYKRGRQALFAGDYATAEKALSTAIEESEWFPAAYRDRGDVYARTGRFSQAVQDLRRAVLMNRADHQARIMLGSIYKQEFAGTQDHEAIRHLSAAVRLRPDLYRLHLLLGELYARSDRQKAREHYQRYIQLAPLQDPDARRARKALEELEREIRKDEPPSILPPAEESLRFLDPELQRLINEAYLRGTEHEDWEQAERILLQARDRFPEEPEVLNELARVVYHQNRLGDARQYWEESLAMQESQVDVHERLGLLLRDDLPDDALPHLERASELGSLTARYVLAELLWERAHFLEADRQLDLYLATASDYDLHWDRARTLREQIDRRFTQFFLVAGVLLTILIVVPTYRIWRHYRGASLRQLLERDPKSFPEVARILSLIRHEILKHNTAFLADVGRALEFDAPDAEQRAEVLGRRLFGDEGDGRGGAGEREGPGGIHGRFLGYLSDLDKVGRAHRVTLNLHRKDPIFRPMIQAFDELADWAPRLRAPHALRGSKKLEAARVLRRAGLVLGRQAFERLSGLIRELCVTNVDAALIESVYAQVLGEKQFAGRPIAELRVQGQGAPVRIFRTDLEDILANVFRNSLRSSLLYAQPPVGLGVDLETEIDEITGLGSLAIRIKDRSPEQLSNEMLRGRYVERGMGITVDLLSRYDGAIGVEDEPGWSKAVVLRFFILEDDTSSVALEAAQ